ncbi:hypothetical protein [Alteriqipengyuania lutimaris]|uniref:Major facilitator superfamily (MFS) profile domain-containing protein n=1 Tax=Alteriqipengyuania lutimaris TaxID=1538146 RepID=A0A395LM94_9SPHN|nr:hypothetical protein [Alteriqipengyuania lutimaris]MBB3032925.1 hypothetical protein [Alteriqipengyuania lutimaris]RDS77991.1 hypothetical protein DL238_10530 [Alteriqipengyuania lutimaris]
MIWVKLIGGAVLGVFGSGLAIMLLEKTVHSRLEGTTMFVAVVVIYAVAAVLGAVLSGWIGGTWAAVAVGVLLAALAAMNTFAMPHPIWFIPASALAIAAGCWIGLRLLQATVSPAA